jgi:exopolysaccharide production protein ExoQ
MRKMPGAMRAGAPQIPRRADRPVGRVIGRVATAGADGGVALILLAILFWLIFYQNLPGNMGLNGTPAGDIAAGNTQDRIIKICMLAMSTYVIAARWSLTRSVVKSINVGAAAFLALALLSFSWSISPADTILRFISLAAIVLTCFAISLAGWHRQRLQQLVLPPLMYILVLSLIVGVLYTDRIMEIGDDISQKGAWHGITITKNQFGMTASLAAIICVNRWLAREGRTIAAIAGAVVAFACLILSRSNASLFATLLGVLFMVLVMRVPVIKQRYSTHVVIAIAVTILLYELVILNILPGAHTLLAPVRTLTGKDATFSARTQIWDVIRDHIQWTPYLGSGYGAYWVGPTPQSPSRVFQYLMYFYPTEAHNGYLDVINDLGYVGLICLLAVLMWYIRQALQLMPIDRSQAALYLALLFQQMVMNMSESEWFARDSTFTVFILGMVCLSRAVLESRREATAVVPGIEPQVRSRLLPQRRQLR